MSDAGVFERISEEVDGWLSPGELKSIYQKEVEGGTMADFAYAIQQARARDLDPLRSEVYFYTEYDENEEGGDPDEEGREVLKLGVKIDGLRTIANRTGEYAGQRGPFWCGEDGEWKEVWLEDHPPKAAKVGVLRKGFDEPLWHVARWDDYAKTHYRTGKPTGMWADMGPFMAAKAAEAGALRRAFPDQLGELYLPAEVDKPKGTASYPDRKTTADRKAKEITQALGGGGEGEEPPTEDPIPEGFPHRTILEENGGLEDLQALRKRVQAETLTEIKGIGPARATDIKEALTDEEGTPEEDDATPETATLFDQ